MDSAEPAFKVEPLDPPRLRLPQFLTTLKLLAIAVGVLLIGGGSIWIFARAQFNEQSVEFTVSGPSQVAAGDSVTYVVNYKNPNKVALNNARLVFHYPPESIPLHDGLVADITQEAIDLKTIEARGQGEYRFEALMVGHQGNVKIARAVLDFIPEDLTTQLQKSVELGVTIASMPVALDVVVPPTVIAGQTVSYVIDYRNQTPDQLRNLRLRVQLPEGFTPNNPKTSWEIPLLAPGDGSRITITGVIQGQKEVKTLSVALQKEVVTHASRFVVDFEKAEESSVIATPLLSLLLSVNNTPDYVAHVGDKLTYRLLVTNNTDVDLTGLSLTARLDGTMFEPSTVETTGSFDGRTKTILWNSSVVPQLGHLRAHESVTVPFVVELKESFGGGALGTQNSFIKVTARTETFNVPDAFPVESLSAGDEMTTKIGTAAAFIQRLVTNDTMFGASLPYPPQVNQTTTFTIRWVVSNASNEIAPASVTGVLLPGVSWQGRYRVVGIPDGRAQPFYNPTTSTLTWNLGNVPAGVGVTLPSYELYFQVSITPSVNEVGQTPELVKDANFTGTDMLTKEKLFLTGGTITTKASVKP